MLSLHPVLQNVKLLKDCPIWKNTLFKGEGEPKLFWLYFSWTSQECSSFCTPLSCCRLTSSFESLSQPLHSPALQGAPEGQRRDMGFCPEGRGRTERPVVFDYFSRWFSSLCRGYGDQCCIHLGMYFLFCPVHTSLLNKTTPTLLSAFLGLHLVGSITGQHGKIKAHGVSQVKPSATETLCFLPYHSSLKHHDSVMMGDEGYHNRKGPCNESQDCLFWTRPHILY